MGDPGARGPPAAKDYFAAKQQRNGRIFYWRWSLGNPVQKLQLINSIAKSITRTRNPRNINMRRKVFD